MGKVSVVCFYSVIGEVRRSLWPLIHIGQQGIVLAPPYPFSNVFGLVLQVLGIGKPFY